jgi:hypothetical protein
MLSIADRPDQALGKRRGLVLFLATLIAGWRIASTGRVFSGGWQNRGHSPGCFQAMPPRSACIPRVAQVCLETPSAEEPISAASNPSVARVFVVASSRFQGYSVAGRPAGRHVARGCH